jgi:hypothetical protein
MRHDAERPPVATAPRRSPSGHALSDARLYRPGPLLAAVILLLPPALALAGAGIALNTLGRIPLWLPLVLLLWVPLLAASWLTMTSVRTSPAGIAVARPWRQWNEVHWTLIERVERHGPLVVVYSSDGRAVRFYPLTLQDAARLRRELLMRLPVHVLDARLRSDARELLGEPIGQRGPSLTSEPLHTRPHRLWCVGLTVATLLAGLGAGAALYVVPSPLALLPACLALAVVVLCARALPTCLQTISLTQSGIAVRGAFSRKATTLAWHDIQLVERTPRERVLRLRGEQRLRCAGPGLLPANDAEVFRVYLHTYCTEQGALVLVRRWL